MNVAIIGCGRMGQKRAAALGKDDELVVACDADIDRAKSLVRGMASGFADDWQYSIGKRFVEAVIICTTPDAAPEIAYAAMQAGKHVLVEKPAAHRACQLAELNETAFPRPRIRVGFSLRYHRAMRQARQWVDEGMIGELLYVRGVYGHGGRLGYEKEWRCDPKISGGGVLIDLGVHLIDLSRWFLGDVLYSHSELQKFFWRECSVEDNAFFTMIHGTTATEGEMTLEVTDGRSQLHCSATEWKNTFQFEIFGRGGKIEINGLGGSYGVERATLYREPPELGPPHTTIREYPMADDSFEVEWAEFKKDIAEKRTPVPGIAEAQAALRIVEAIYEANR